MRSPVRSDMIAHLLVLLMLGTVLLKGTLETLLWVALSAGLAWVASTTAFFFGLLTLDGRRAAWVLGTVVLGLGGWLPTLLVLFFFGSTTLLSFILDPVDSKRELSERRSGGQVWANGIWVVLLSIIYSRTGDPLYLLLIASAVAVVTADTWASLTGRSVSGLTWHLFPYRIVEPGEDGGISIAGTLAAVAASTLIAAMSVFWLPEARYIGFWGIFLAGVVGCFIDSFLGQRNWMRRGFGRGPGDDSDEDERVNNLINATSSILGIWITLLIWVGGTT